MKLAFSQATQDVATLFASYRAAGYDGLQLKTDQYPPYLDAPQRFLDEHGGKPGAASGMIALWSRGAESTEKLRKIIKFGAAVGTELLVVAHCEKRELFKDDDIRAAAKQLSALGAEARALKVKLSLHNHFDSLVMHRPDFTTFFNAIEPGTVGLTVDTAHLAKSGVMDMGGLIRDMRGVIDNFHLKDFRAGEFRVLGDGDVDFKPVFAAIHDIGYDGWVCADEESGADVRAAMAQCHRFMTRGLGSASA